MLGLGHQPALYPHSVPVQLSLRLKAMKRQVEEAEEEIDRLESSKKKLQRELEEQMDMNEHLQGQLNSMKKDLRWAGVEAKKGPIISARLKQSLPSEHSHSCCLKPAPHCCFWGYLILEVEVVLSTSVTLHGQ